MKKQKRNANFELLRIIAMFMIVILHYLSKGNVLKDFETNTTSVNIVAWIIQAFCVVAVNVYVLISGYYLVKKEFRIKKWLGIVFQVLFYSITIPIVCYIFNIGGIREWGIYQWLIVVLPMQMEHYWFATSYLILYLISPFLAAGIKTMSKKRLEVILCVMIFVFSELKSLIPMLLSTDKYGYDFGWFICLFLIAGYIRMYGMPVINTKEKAAILYLLSVFFVFAIGFVSARIGTEIDAFSYYSNMAYSYNYILVLSASLGLFLYFLYRKINHNLISRIILKISPLTFGVYLLHENIAIRSLWQDWFGVYLYKNSFYFIPHMILVVSIIFVIGCSVEYIRIKIMRRIK
ncbi:MAG: acyltransferase [Lachnospiraceae bacterium]